MNSTFFSVGIQGEILHGIVDQPDVDMIEGKKAMVFLNGMGGYRTGPHDMFVTFSRKLAQLGYHCVRFDFRGKGFSGDAKWVASYASMMEDVDAIIAYVKDEMRIKDISVTGICIGAKLALYYTKSGVHDLNKLILLSSVPLRLDDKTAQDAYLQTKLHLKDYTGKLRSRETWSKFFTGRIHFVKIVRKILSPFFSISRRKISSQPKQTGFQVLKALNGVLVIHGENDPETIVALPQIEGLLGKYSVPYESVIIEGANHSFYSMGWTRQLTNLICNWLGGEHSHVG